MLLYATSTHCFAAPEHWVTTWGCAPQLTEPYNLPPTHLAGHTLRQFVHVSLGGHRLRLRLANTFGVNAVTLDAVHIAQAPPDASAGTGNIYTNTDQPLLFHGQSLVTIPPGATVLSDPLKFNLPALSDLAITIAFGNISAQTITGHPGSRTTSFLQADNTVSAASLPHALSNAHWYIINGVDVLTRPTDASVVVLGDSITDGRGSTTDGNDRWPDALARRLATNGVAVVNMGIGGNGIFGGLGPAALKRFDRDVLDQSGVRWLILFEGVNDIGTAHNTSIATNLITAYQQLIVKAHAHNLRVYAATITPFGGHSYYTPVHETARQTVNTWIRTNHLADGVIDFDAEVRDPVTLTNLISAYNSGDGLHLNPAGYEAMAGMIDLSAFTP